MSPSHAPIATATDSAVGRAAGADPMLEVVHETRYGYTSPVSLAHHLAHLQPLDDAAQQVVDWQLAIEPAPSHQRDSVDSHGNRQRHFSLHAAHSKLAVRSTCRVRLHARFAALRAEAAPAWDTLAGGLRYVARSRFEPALEYALPSPYVPRLAALTAFGAPSFTPGRPVAEVALELMHRIHAGFEYQSRSTDIDTPLSRVLEHRRGVCQDFAHLLAGCLRARGVPARYVSGYLLTRAPEDGHAMLGADASHAWVQVWCPDTPGVPLAADGAWLDLDPTNDLVPGAGHVRVAVGRDFGDVTPLRGVIRGGGRHDLGVAVHTRLIGTGGTGGAAGATGPTGPTGAPLARVTSEESTRS